MKDLLVTRPTANKAPDKDKRSVSQKDDQLNTENATEGSSIKVSISQDSLLAKSPQHKQPQQTSEKKPNAGSTLSHITESSSTSAAEKNAAKEEKKLSRKGTRSAERLHR